MLLLRFNGFDKQRDKKEIANDKRHTYEESTGFGHSIPDSHRKVTGVEVIRENLNLGLRGRTNVRSVCHREHLGIEPWLEMIPGMGRFDGNSHGILPLPACLAQHYLHLKPQWI